MCLAEGKIRAWHVGLLFPAFSNLLLAFYVTATLKNIVSGIETAHPHPIMKTIQEKICRRSLTFVRC